jgi:K+-sensing histidine kinase KdpD
MIEEPILPGTGALRPRELEAVYAVSNAVAAVTDLEEALDKISQLTRPVLIFDNIVVYVLDEARELEPTYARIIGRGRSAEGDLSWGESAANQVIQTGQNAIQNERLPDWETNRLNLRYMLGLPLRSRQKLLGALIFGRFGGPVFSADQIHLAEFIATHISQLLVRQHLVEQVANLEAERRLRQLQDNFISTVSHELTTPLGFIKGYATTLLREDISWDEDSRREFLQIIDEETDRLRELIDNLLDSSRLQAGTLRMELQQIRLDAILQEFVMRSKTRYPDMIIELESPRNVIIQADPVRLIQVFDNLISNAAKYAPGSPVKIMLDTQSQAEQCVHHITVRDFGPGIAPEYLDRLFERFFRVPESSHQVHGTGLGLFICSEIINVHGGEMKVDSKPGEGVSFHIFLPVIDAVGA